jgi:hypothetical protein
MCKKGGPRCKPKKSISGKWKDIASEAIPRESKYQQYYADTDAKHFHDKNKPGSKFTDPSVKNLNDVVALAASQRGSLEGDDRDALIGLGAEPTAFGADFRYLMVQTSGKLGAQDLSTFPVGTLFRVERTKAGASCSVVADVETQEATDFGVIIMGRTDVAEQDVVITAHPGLPVSRSGEGTFDAYENHSLTADQIREIAGMQKININTLLIANRGI